MVEKAEKNMSEHLNQDAESINRVRENTNINFPNSINYPRGGAANSSNPNNSNSNPHNNNQQSQHNNNQSQNNTPDDESGKAKKKISGRLLVTLIFIVIIYQYISFVFYFKPILPPNDKDFTSRLILLFIFHFILIMMIWSFIVTMKTIPGFIPLYWGFYIGDEEYKRKRYCLICNAFKPERSHHCSVCNICVLNMDHHCPWVNNCIGFYNRKFFMQLLFYLLILLYFILIVCLPEIYEICKHMYIKKLHIDEKTMIEYLVFLPSYILIMVLTVLNSMFFKYHFYLVLNNSTTIESLDPDNKENQRVSHFNYNIKS